MSLVNHRDREIHWKIVYYGPVGSGKTANLRYVHHAAPRDRLGCSVRLGGRDEHRLGFDVLPLELGSLAGFLTRIQLCSVPGAGHFQATRNMVLDGADGIVFVADSQRRQLDANIRSLQTLRTDLVARNVDVRNVPLVLQYNKRDLPTALLLSPSELDAKLNYRAVPSVNAEAVNGRGVFETLEAVTQVILGRAANERTVLAWT